MLPAPQNDEARHAGLAWKTVRWAYSQANDEEKASIREALTRPFAMESGRAPATEEEKHEESVMEAYGEPRQQSPLLPSPPNPPLSCRPGRARALALDSAEASVAFDDVSCAGVLSPYKTRMLDEDHRDWLLPAMTKALLEGGPVKLKDDSVRLTHKKRRSSEVNLYVARFLDLAGAQKPPRLPATFCRHGNANSACGRGQASSAEGSARGRPNETPSGLEAPILR